VTIIYDAIIFDLDGTIVSEHGGVAESRAAVANLIRNHGYNISNERYANAAQRVIDNALANNRGSWPRNLTGTDAIRRALYAINIPTDLAPYCAEVYKHERVANLELISGALEILESLREKIPLGLITNGDSLDQRKKLNRFSLDRYFSPILISGDLAIEKPNPAIFRLALDIFNVPAGKSVYIGNSFVNDIEGAAAVGINTIWLNEKQDPSPVDAKYFPTTTIHSLLDLEPLLGVGSN